MTITSDERAPDSVEDQAPQPSLLPDDHGSAPTGMRIRFSGAGDGDRSHSVGETGYFLVRGVRGPAAHKQTKKFGLLYDEAFAVTDVIELAGDSGRDLLAGARQQRRMEADRLAGRTSLFDADRPVPSRIVWADANGYVLSEEDLAEIRGDEHPLTEEPFDLSDEALAAAEDREAHLQVTAPQRLRAVLNGDTEGYDDIIGTFVIDAVKQIDDRDVILACDKHEAENQNRKGVRSAFAKRLRELEGGE